MLTPPLHVNVLVILKLLLASKEAPVVPACWKLRMPEEAFTLRFPVPLVPIVLADEPVNVKFPW
jgi:hypothetical protein